MDLSFSIDPLSAALIGMLVVYMFEFDKRLRKIEGLMPKFAKRKKA